jgi:hypothetical protein
MSAIGAMTKWMQPVAIGTTLGRIEHFDIVVTGWCGIRNLMFTEHRMEVLGMKLWTCKVEVR